MKTKITNYGTMALFIAFSFMTTTIFAGQKYGDGPSADLKYIGVVQDNPVFQLDLNSTDVKNYTIAIKDLDGNTLYKENIKAKNVSRKFALDVDYIDDEVLKVEVYADKNSKPEVFTITRNTKFVEEATISKP
jgi:hypothetical protein